MPPKSTLPHLLDEATYHETLLNNEVDLDIMLKKTLNYTRKFWNFAWHGEGVLSWISCIIISFILIKYIFYPVIGLIFGTSFPIVAVVSGSMEHKGTIEEWWGEFTCCENTCTVRKIQSTLYEPLQLTLNDFKSYPFKNGFNKGDIMFIVKPTNIQKGDVIVFRGNQRFDPIIHRVVEVKDNGNIFKTKGDANCGIHDFEQNILKEGVFGKAVFRIPFLGWLKIMFVSLLNSIGYPWW